MPSVRAPFPLAISPVNGMVFQFQSHHILSGRYQRAKPRSQLPFRLQNLSGRASAAKLRYQNPAYCILPYMRKATCKHNYFLILFRIALTLSIGNVLANSQSSCRSGSILTASISFASGITSNTPNKSGMF